MKKLSKKDIGLLKDMVLEKLQNRLKKLIMFTLQNSKPNYEKIDKYKDKYKNAPKELIALRLIKSASNKTLLNGAVGGLAISASETSAVINGPLALGVTAAAITEDIIAVTAIQMQLIIDVVALYGCEFDLEDEEDVWIIFRLALGLQIKDDLLKGSKVLIDEAGIKNLRRLLRYHLQRAKVQKLAEKYLGEGIAKALAEKNILKIIPYANIAIGGGINSFTTTKVGKTAIYYGKLRTAMFRHIDKMESLTNDYSYLILYTLRYISEYFDSISALDDFALVWRCTTAKLPLSEKNIDDIEELDDIKAEFLKYVSKVESKEVKEEIYKVAETAIATLDVKDAIKYLDSLKKLAKAIDMDYDQEDFETKLVFFNKKIKGKK